MFGRTVGSATGAVNTKIPLYFPFETGSAKSTPTVLQAIDGVFSLHQHNAREHSARCIATSKNHDDVD